MPYHLFQLPLPGAGDLAEMNAFLASHQVVSVQQHLVNTLGGGLLVFVVQTTSPTGKPETPKRRVDYKLELTPEQFAVFSILREERKRIAETEGVPIYTIFTNDHLAEMVRKPVRCLSDLAAIPGIGKARLEKHGERLLTLLTDQHTATAPNLS